jgi:hypothetical protein
VPEFATLPDDLLVCRHDVLYSVHEKRHILTGPIFLLTNNTTSVWAGIAQSLAGRPEDRIPVEPRFSAPVQTGPGAQPASSTMGTGYFPEVGSGRGVALTPHPLLVPRSKNRVEQYP